jgi:hypothetical protein
LPHSAAVRHTFTDEETTMATTRRGSITIAVATVSLGLLAFAGALHGATTRVAPVQRDVPVALSAVSVDVATARAWQNSYRTALGSRDWRPLIEAGDAAVHLDVADALGGAKANARKAYLAALTRAERRHDAAGVAAVADAFARLGDDDVASRLRRF